MKTFNQIREELLKASKQVLEAKDGHLTMVTADGEEHHVIQGMAHNKANAAKVRNAVGKAAAKHAGVSHSAMDKGYSDYTHHELAATAHTDKKPAAKGAPRYGGHGSMKIHKSVDAYVKHHAKNDAKFHKANHMPVKGRKSDIYMGDI